MNDNQKILDLLTEIAREAEELYLSAIGFPPHGNREGPLARMRVAGSEIESKAWEAVGIIEDAIERNSK